MISNLLLIKNFFYQNLTLNCCLGTYLYFLKNYYYYQKPLVSNTEITCLWIFNILLIFNEFESEYLLNYKNKNTENTNIKLHIKNYSNKYFVVFINSKKFNKNFLNLKGIWEKNLYNKKKKGWLFPKSKYNDVLSIINDQ